MNTALVDISLFIANLILMAFIIRGDISKRKIGNKVCLLVICLSVVSAISHGFVVSSILNSIVIFIVFFIIWRLGVMGAGDVKLISGYSIAIVPELIIANFVFIGLIGGVQVSVMYIVSLVRGTTPFDKGIPYGVAISISGVILSYVSTFQ